MVLLRYIHSLTTEMYPFKMGFFTDFPAFHLTLKHCLIGVYPDIVDDKMGKNRIATVQIIYTKTKEHFPENTVFVNYF